LVPDGGRVHPRRQPDARRVDGNHAAGLITAFDERRVTGPPVIRGISFTPDSTMDLRISLQTVVSRSLFSEQQQTAALAHLQEQASSGNRILAPEDDPLGSIAVINYTTQNASLDTDLTNISTATDVLNVGVSTLQDVHNVLTQARQLAIQGTNGGN